MDSNNVTCADPACRHLRAMHRQQLLQDQLLHSSRTLSVGEMATTVAHELNQPLSAIIQCLHAAQRQLQRMETHPPRLEQALSMAVTQAHQAASVIVRIREFVQQREPRRETCELTELIEQALSLAQPELHCQQIAVHQDLAEPLPPVQVDPVMIIQVLTNLIRNAVDAMRDAAPDDRLLTLSATLDVEQRIRVAVVDRGCGIAPGDMTQLFTAFYTTKAQGMGIGLAICRSIIEFHDGNLYCETNAHGGASFIFTLPTLRN